MIAVDTNILVYANRGDAPFHDVASNVMRSLSEGTQSWAIPWPCAHEFFSIVTNPRIFKPPSTVDRALAQLGAWMESPGLNLLSETAQHWSELRTVIASARVVGPMVHDAKVMALCRQHGVRELWTADRDFSRFSGLIVRNPLV